MARPVFDARDYEQNHLTGAIGYILFFIPLLADKSSRFHRFCANQGLLGLIVFCAVSLISGIVRGLLGWIPLIGWLIGLICSLMRLAVVALMVWYAWKAYNGQAEELPFIGGIELIR